MWLVFVVDVVLFDIWDCLKCGYLVGCQLEVPFNVLCNELYKIYLAYVKEWCTDEDVVAILEEVL